MGWGHEIDAQTRVTAETAEFVARIMASLSTASRVRILSRLRLGPATVGELTEAVEMSQPAVSHQLRVLRDRGLVVRRRHRRHVVYELFDSHVAGLLDEALRHIEHLRMAGVGRPPEPPSQITTATIGEHRMSEEHAHEGAHDHEHDHDGQVHSHAHDTHDHDHVEHEHEHSHGGETHSHGHAHQAGLEDQHDHAHY